MRMLLIASAVLLTAFAPAPLPRREKGKDHQSQLVGTWHIRTIKWQGRDSYHAASVGGGMLVNKSDRVVISRGRIVFEGMGGRSGDRVLTFQLSGGGQVRSIDLTNANWQHPVLGLYELRGGVLYLSVGIHNDRPKSLTGDGDEIGFILDRR